MKTSGSTQLRQRLPRIGVSIATGVALLSLLTLLGAASTQASVALFSPQTQAVLLTNGSVLTIGVGSAQTIVPEIGWRQLNAAQLAISQTNAAGGVSIGGVTYTLALASADSACNPVQAAVAANTLLNAGAIAVVGHTCTGASNAAQSIYAAAGVPMISASSTGPALTEQGYTTTFRVISNDNSSPILLATHLRIPLGLDKAALIEWNGFWGNWAINVISDTFIGLGGTLTSWRTVTSTDEFTDTLAAIKPEGPKAIFFCSDAPDTAGMLSKIAHNLGMNDVPIAWLTFTDDKSVLGTYASAAGTAAEGDYAGMFYRSAEDMPGYAAFNTAYQNAHFYHYGDEAQANGAFAYDAAQIIIAALKRANSTAPADLRNEIAATGTYAGVVGTYEGFDSKGDVIPQWAWIERYKNGTWVIVETHKLFLPLVLRNAS